MSWLYHGDCFEELRNLPSNYADLILTDPPYGMNYQSRTKLHNFARIANDNTLEWVEQFCRECFRVLKPDTHLYMFCNDYSLGIFRLQLKWAGFNVKRTLVWVKNNHSMGNYREDYASKTEFIVFAHKGRRPLQGFHTNVLKFARTVRPDHPTPKPVDLCKFLIAKSSNPGDLVLDPFMGVGATMVAAKELGRRYAGIEIDEGYYKSAKQRLREIEQPLLVG